MCESVSCICPMNLCCFVYMYEPLLYCSHIWMAQGKISWIEAMLPNSHISQTLERYTSWSGLWVVKVLFINKSTVSFKLKWTSVWKQCMNAHIIIILSNCVCRLSYRSHPWKRSYRSGDLKTLSTLYCYTQTYTVPFTLLQ